MTLANPRSGGAEMALWIAADHELRQFDLQHLALVVTRRLHYQTQFHETTSFKRRDMPAPMLSHASWAANQAASTNGEKGHRACSSELRANGDTSIRRSRPRARCTALLG